jgi:hypothetical protein
LDTTPTNRRLLFVIGTGRCGTQSIADLISRVPECEVEHERKPVLLGEAIDYLEGRTSHRSMVDLLRQTRGPETFSAKRVAGESNQRLALVLPALAEAVPEARYVWLIRDGRETVDSLHRRLWYHRDEGRVRSMGAQPVPGLRSALREWAASRPDGHRLGVIDRGEWEAMDRFARCCWYWSYTNDLIERQARALGLQMLELRLEDLSQQMPALARHAGLAEHELGAAPRSNSSSDVRNPGFAHWSRGQWDIFDRYAGGTMDRLYPSWRTSQPASGRISVAGFVSAWERATSSARRRLIGAALRSRGLHPSGWQRSARGKAGARSERS